VSHLEKYRINGIELWNQQADGSHMPPVGFLQSLQSQPLRNNYRYFFGCDLHDASLTVTNVLSLRNPGRLTVEAVVSVLMSGTFLSRNIPTAIEYHNGPEKTDFDTWLQATLKKSYYRGKLRQSVRSGMKRVYRLLPRDVQHLLNDIKNYIRNKV
jgi:hypothetical protein